MLRSTRVEANVDLKDQRAKVLEGRLQPAQWLRELNLRGALEQSHLREGMNI